MLMLIMAQAGLGKSVFLSNLAVNLLKQNLSVVVISLEMSENVYAQRFDAHISESNINQLKANKTSALARIKAFRDKYQNAALYIKEYPPRSVKTRDIELYLENLKNNGKKFDVVIVDYLGLVLPNNKSDSMYKDGLAVSEELRALSYKFTVPIISAVQCNTSAMNSEEIDMEHVSESRGIVHTVDALFALYQTDADRENQIINMRILKNRLGGKVGKIANFTLDPESLVLNDITFDNNINHNIKSIEQEFSDLDNKFNSLSSDIDDL
jgi:replicative DNA helicase